MRYSHDKSCMYVYVTTNYPFLDYSKKPGAKLTQ